MSAYIHTTFRGVDGTCYSAAISRVNHGLQDRERPLLMPEKISTP